MKRIVAHGITAFATFCVLCVRLRASTSLFLLLWHVPSLITQCSVFVLLLLNLRNKPLHVEEKRSVFFAALLSSNFSVFVSLFGGLFPFYGTAPIADLQIAGNIVNLLSMPFYLWALLTLGKGLAVLPEACVLRTGGVYQISRHPLYLTYILWCLTQILIFQTVSVLIFSLCQITLYRFRAIYEEKVLADTFPEYTDYKNKVMWLGARKSADALTV